MVHCCGKTCFDAVENTLRLPLMATVVECLFEAISLQPGGTLEMQWTDHLRNYNLCTATSKVTAAAMQPAAVISRENRFGSL